MMWIIVLALLVVIASMTVDAVRRAEKIRLLEERRQLDVERAKADYRREAGDQLIAGLEEELSVRAALNDALCLELARRGGPCYVVKTERDAN